MIYQIRGDLWLKKHGTLFSAWTFRAHLGLEATKFALRGSIWSMKWIEIMRSCNRHIRTCMARRSVGMKKYPTFGCLWHLMGFTYHQALTAWVLYRRKRVRSRLLPKVKLNLFIMINQIYCWLVNKAYLHNSKNEVLRNDIYPIP